MIKLIPSHLRFVALIAGMAAAMVTPIAFANSSEDFTPSLVSPTNQEDISLLNRRLQSVRKGLEQYLIFAEYFNANGDTKTVEQLQTPVDDYMKRHVDPLLIKGTEQASTEATRLSAEIMSIKARLLMNLNQIEAARATVAELKRRFGSFQKNMVQVAGKSIMLSEEIRQLDEELANPARGKKK